MYLHFSLSPTCKDWNSGDYIEDEYILILCRITSYWRTDYKQIFAFPKIINQTQSSSENRLSVAIVGIDSVSRLNFIRQLPQTYAYIKENLSAVEMFGFSRVGLNTLPNIGPMLTGLTEEEMYADLKMPISFDDVPFIWKEFKDNGYLTVLSEDYASMGLFNWREDFLGFIKEPTDIYKRPLDLAIPKELEIIPFLHTFCAGTKFELEIQHEWFSDLVKDYDNENYFIFSWSNLLTHDLYNHLHLADANYRTLFHDIHPHLNETVVIFLADHGYRLDYDLTKTQFGTLEANLPFCFIIVPSWFKDKYSVEYDNLQQNAHRLTSPFDIHATHNNILFSVLHWEVKFIIDTNNNNIQQEFCRAHNNFDCCIC